MAIYQPDCSKYGTWEKLVSTLTKFTGSECDLSTNDYLLPIVPALVLGIIVSPVAGKMVNVADWDHDGIYHDSHELAYVGLPDLPTSTNAWRDSS